MYIFFNRSLNKDHSVCMNKALYCSQGLGSGLILSGSGSRSNLSGSTIFSRQDPDPGKKRTRNPDPDPSLMKIVHKFFDNFQLEIGACLTSESSDIIFKICFI